MGAGCDEEEDGLSVAAIRLLLFTGCRKGDVVDEVGSGPDTKNGPSRTVHLNAKAQEVLVELQGRREQEARTEASEFVLTPRDEEGAHLRSAETLRE